MSKVFTSMVFSNDLDYIKCDYCGKPFPSSKCMNITFEQEQRVISLDVCLVCYIEKCLPAGKRLFDPLDQYHGDAQLKLLYADLKCNQVFIIREQEQTKERIAKIEEQISNIAFGQDIDDISSTLF